jgi:hypothetical protein
MKQYQVVCLSKGAGDLVKPEDIQEVIGEHTKEGWHLVQMTTGGGGDYNIYIMWVYLVFER